MLSHSPNDGCRSPAIAINFVGVISTTIIIITIVVVVVVDVVVFTIAIVIAIVASFIAIDRGGRS